MRVWGGSDFGEESWGRLVGWLESGSARRRWFPLFSSSSSSSRSAQNVNEISTFLSKDFQWIIGKFHRGGG